MDARYYIDPGTHEPHIYGHSVNEREVEDVLDRPIEDRPGREGSRVAIGQTRAGRFLRVIYVPDGQPGSILVITAYQLGPKALRALRRRRKKEGMSDKPLPPGWDESRVRRVVDHYESQTDDEAATEDQEAFESTTHTVMEVPVDLVPEVRRLIARRRAG